MIIMEKQKKPSTLGQMPEGYKLGKIIDLENNRKQLILVNACAVLVAVALIAPMLFLVPIQGLFKLNSFGFGGFVVYALRFATLLVGSVLYVILHELTHALFMKIFGAKRVKIGFNFIYAYAESRSEYFRKWPYIVIALAPVVIFFIIFALICPFIYNTPWFWVVYLWQVQNLSGAIGDIIVSLMLLNKPKNSYIQDKGTNMRVLVPKD